MSKKNNIHKLDKEKNVIGIEQFIINYLNDGNYVTCYDLTHKDLKSFGNPDVIRIPDGFASAYKEYLYDGVIIMVRDILNHVAPYINPSNLKALRDMKDGKQVVDEARVMIISDLLYDLDMYMDDKKKKQERKIDVEEEKEKVYVKEYKRR